ncbi:uncharacterized protein BROUX77_001088 [Berkeleyomyces rouxiae]|uniref:uncharacterized protein n=1 Tax=Berkeleyomyces rouxiae TaxID=2035830 RepID=UPI003B78208F
MVDKKIVRGLTIDTKTVELSRNWLTNKEVIVPLQDVETSITHNNLPAVGQVPFVKWLKTLQEIIIISNTAALFVGDDLVDVTSHSLIARNCWMKVLKKSSHRVTFRDDISLKKMLEKISESAAKIDRATAAVKIRELASLQMRNIHELPKVITLIKDRVAICETYLTELGLMLALTLQPILSPIDGQLAERVDECTTVDELLDVLDNRAHSLVESTEPSLSCAGCGKDGHSVEECRRRSRKGKRKTKAKAEAKAEGTVSSLRTAEAFLVDSGADHSILPVKEHFSSYVPIASYVNVVGDKHVQALGRGSVEFLDDQGVTVKIENVLHIPQQEAIISAGELLSMGYMFETLADKVTRLSNNQGSTLTLNIRNKRIWYDIPTPKVSSLKADRDWHRAFAHINTHYVQRTLAQHGLKLKVDHSKCQSCIKAKITHSPKATTGLRRATEALEYLHLDLVGGKNALPKATSSTDFPLADQFLLVVDEFSLYRWAFPVHSKKDIAILIDNFIEQLKTQFGRHPKVLHSDDASEFKSSKCLELAERRGMLWQRSAAYAHEQNGIVERSVRTVCEALSATHECANLPSKLWPETLQGVLYVLNRTANSVVPTSPYQVVYGKLPDIGNLYPIGCRAVWPMEGKKNGKVPVKGVSGVLLGYHSSNSCYVLEDGPDKRVITRRDVSCNDKVFPYKSSIMALKGQPEISVSKALTGPEEDKWRDAMRKEINTIESYGSWEIIPAHAAPRRPMNGKWVLRKKDDGTHKARWCACGYDEQINSDISADVLHGVSLRMVLALIASRDLVCHHIDVKSAFLNAELEKPEYIRPPDHMGFPSDCVLKLKKAIYGLRSAPKRWQQTLQQHLGSIGFTPLKNDGNIFFNGQVWIAVYVDDMLVLSKETSDVQDVIVRLAAIVDLRDLGPVSTFLGINIRHSSSAINIDQKSKIDKLVERMNLSQCRGSSIPISNDNLIDQESEPLSQNDHDTYRSIVGSLLHISLYTRPDIAYTVMRLAARTHNPTDGCQQALKHCLRYLHRTAAHSLAFPKTPGKDILASTDSSWGNNTSSRAVSGNMFLINGAPVMWRARKQTLTAQSTCEAEYVSAAGLATTAIWLKPLFEELFGIEESAPIRVQMDNQSALAVANGSKVSTRNRHFLIKQTSLREAIEAKVINVIYTPTDQMIADGLTKALPKAAFDTFLCRLGMEKGECCDIKSQPQSQPRLSHIT